MEENRLDDEMVVFLPVAVSILLLVLDDMKEKTLTKLCTMDCFPFFLTSLLRLQSAYHTNSTN